MKRYFFDVGNQSQSMYDYQGRDFETPEAAYQLAEMMALELGGQREVGWLGGRGLQPGWKESFLNSGAERGIEPEIACGPGMGWESTPIRTLETSPYLDGDDSEPICGFVWVGRIFGYRVVRQRVCTCS